MEGIKGYSRPSTSGGVTVDTEAMLVDLITVVKAGGVNEADFLKWVRETWSLVEVDVTIPQRAKN